MDRTRVIGPVAGVRIRRHGEVDEFYPMDAYNPSKVEFRGVCGVDTIYGWFAHDSASKQWRYAVTSDELQAALVDVPID